jgi:NDP-sugar pyrophosphorylase family protein
MILILCGGRGSRLSGVWDKPKILAPVGDKPYIKRLFSMLEPICCEQKITLATGIGSNAIRQYLDEQGLNVNISEESSELGTGGALLHFLKKYNDSRITVINGDTLYNAKDIENYFFVERNSTNKNLIATRKVGFNDRFGHVHMDGVLKIKRPDEPIRNSEVFAGIVTLNIDQLRDKEIINCSLENTINEMKIARSDIIQVDLEYDFYDIGTPINLENAEKWWKKS